jgi:hypothetical protein
MAPPRFTRELAVKRQSTTFEAHENGRETNALVDQALDRGQSSYR